MLDHTEVERYLALLAARQDLRELLQLDHYILGERLGEGGFSWVYKLINPDTGQGDLAFKIVSADTCKHANRSAGNCGSVMSWRCGRGSIWSASTVQRKAWMDISSRSFSM